MRMREFDDGRVSELVGRHQSANQIAKGHEKLNAKLRYFVLMRKRSLAISL